MALGSYQALLESIPLWLHRQGDAEVISAAADMVTRAESEIYVRLRTRYHEARLGPVAMSSGEIPIPPDYTDLKFVYLQGAPIQNLTRKSVDWIFSQFPFRSADSRPEFIARDLNSFIFGPYPDTDYTVTGVYYRSFTNLSLENPSNILLQRYPKLFLTGSLLKAEMFIRNDPSIDSMMGVWRAEFNQAFEEAQGETEREESSGGRVSMSVVGYSP